MKSVLFLFFPARRTEPPKRRRKKRRSGVRSERKGRASDAGMSSVQSLRGDDYSILTVAEPILFQKHKSGAPQTSVLCQKSRESANPIADSPLYKVQDPVSRVPKRPANGGPPSSLIPQPIRKSPSARAAWFCPCGPFPKPPHTDPWGIRRKSAFQAGRSYVRS